MNEGIRWHTLSASRKVQLLACKEERVQQHMAEIQRRQEDAKADLRMFSPSRLNSGPWRRKSTAERRRLKRQNHERQRDVAKLHEKLMDKVLHTTVVVDDEDVQSPCTKPISDAPLWDTKRNLENDS